MDNLHKSSSRIQAKAEEVIFSQIEILFNIRFEKNKKLYLADNAFIFYIRSV